MKIAVQKNDIYSHQLQTQVWQKIEAVLLVTALVLLKIE